MYNYLRSIGVLVIVLCATSAQAYKFTVTNHTTKEHTVQMKVSFVDWQPMTVAPKGGKIEKNFGGAQMLLCLEGFKVDDEMKVITVDAAQLNNLMKYVDNPKELDAYLTSSGIYNNAKRAATSCGDQNFFILEVPTGFVTILFINPSKQINLRSFL